MQLSVKHANQQLSNRSDYKGGLNTSVAVEMIRDDQLYEVVNMEPDSATSLLKTVDGTENILRTDFTVFSGIYDKINKLHLLISTETETLDGETATVHNVYTANGATVTAVGRLSGSLIPDYTLWENGVLLSSGSYLQYYNGATLLTIASATTKDAANWKQIKPVNYSAGTAYAVGAVVKSGGAWYLCKTAHTAVSLIADAANWTVLAYVGAWVASTAYTVNTVIRVGNEYYLCQTAHTALSYDAPKVTDCSFIRDGRVIVSTGPNNELRYSGTGDETNWEADSNVDSSAKYIETGYKDGGRFIGMANLSSDIVFFKENGYAYRLSGSYPNWVMQSISHEVDCDGRLSFCALTNTVLVLGKNTVQLIDTTQDYSDMKATNVGKDVADELRKLPAGAQAVYIPPLNQVWFLGDNGKVVFYDCNQNSFWLRKFNSKVVGVYHAENEVIVVKENGLDRLKSRSFNDNGLQLKWRFRAKRMVSQHEFLLKRVQINITPYFDGYSENSITVGRLTLPLPVPWIIYRIYNNFARIYGNTAHVTSTYNEALQYAIGEEIYENSELIYENDRRVYEITNLSRDVRCVYRNRSIDIRGSGSGSFILNSINFDIAEV